MAPYYEGHSTTNVRQMSESIRSCAPPRVVIQNSKISTDDTVKNAGFRAIN